MPVITIAHKPDLTIEKVVEIFRKRFEPKYRVEVLKGFFGRGVLFRRRDFIVVKNPWVGVTVKLEQSGSKTKFVFNGRVPRWWAWHLGGFELGFLLWVGLRKEVEELIRTAPEFRDAAPAAGGGASGTASESDVGSQLRQLAALHDSGVIPDEEFAAKKTELLSRM